jgi:hypothetical protein
MKQPFRYFRGEFNGAYLYNLVRCPNYTAQDITDELVYHILFQWKLEDEITAHEMAIRDDDIINIGKIAGLFQPRTSDKVSLGSTYFTQSHVVNGKQRSERGLMDMDNESFKFVREEYDDYPDDIVNEASDRFRMGLVPPGTEPVGYVLAGTPLYDSEGTILWENVLPDPPTDGSAYIPFYGEKFLVHEEFFNRETPLAVDIFKLLLECVQRIRHNGPTIKSLFDVTQILGEGYIYDLKIEAQARYYLCYYRVNEDTTVLNRERRFGAWQNICKQKFKLFEFTPYP